MSEPKSFLEMSNRELFCILAGDGDIMAQTLLKKMIREFMKKYPDREADLSTMVKVMAEEE